MMERSRSPHGIEWPTVILLAACYGAWALATSLVADWSLWAGFCLTVLALTLQSSLQHEVLHGHPFRSGRLNEALVFLPIGLVYPYRRFRDLHLAHHRDERLTDPYDDPESNFLDPGVWAGLSRVSKLLLRANNALLGRMVMGPVIGTAAFLKGDVRLLAAGDREVLRAWALHAAAMVPVIAWVWVAPMPGWLYLASAYAALSVLKIRTFLEHRAHELARGRTVVVEGPGVLPFLFLNNNLHIVHHARPRLAWYELPEAYRENKGDWLRRNDGYLYKSYWQVFRQHFLSPKDPVPHPLYPRL
ncbi:MAG: fatty acid desaturase [Paracoccaceae bacterium]